jgi:drug/metabolite transporter (DMT)-like permease
MIILGGSVTLTRQIVDYPAMTGQAMRYAGAAALLAALARVVSRGPAGPRLGSPGTAARPNRRDLAVLMAIAATGLAAFNLCILTAVRHADTAVVGTIVGAAPLGLALVGPLARRQPPALRLVGAAAVLVAGTALVHGAGRADLLGTVAAGGALAGEILFSVLAAIVLPRLGAVRVSAYSCALAVPMLLAGAVMAGELGRWRAPTAAEAATLAYLAVMLTVVAFVAWFTGLRWLGVERAGLYVGVLPVATLVTTAIADGVLPAPAQTLGVVVVAAGLAFGLTSPRTGPVPRHPSTADRRPRARRVRSTRP